MSRSLGGWGGQKESRETMGPVHLPVGGKKGDAPHTLSSLDHSLTLHTRQ